MVEEGLEGAEEGGCEAVFEVCFFVNMLRVERRREYRRDIRGGRGRRMKRGGGMRERERGG